MAKNKKPVGGQKLEKDTVMEDGDEAPAPEEVPDEGAENEEPTAPVDKEGAGEPTDPPVGSHKITIEGEGSIPLITNGAVHRVARGEPVEVSDAELALLEAEGIEFKKEAKGSKKK